MLFQITHICLIEPDYVTQHSAMNKITENGAKMAGNGAIMVFSY